MVEQTAIRQTGVPAPTPPPLVGGYRLQRLLGRGAMGEVWLGQHAITRGLAAIKVMRSEAVANPRWREFFARERKAVGRLSHPHVVRLYDVGDDYIATAYVQGADLAQRLKASIAPEAAVRIARQVASALAHAHERQVVHRDVKPSNILLDSEGNAYLADFGIALLLDDPEEPTGRRQAGTPAYMAPEQHRGEALGPAADQYALARTLLVMLVGGAVPQDPSEALHHLPANLPRPLHDALTRALHPHAAQRYPSLLEFANDLDQIDLSHFPAPQLAPLLMDPAPFRWAGGAERSTPIGPDIMRADYRLSQLEALGLLTPEACAAFRKTTGYADFGWALYGRTQRLGNLTHPSAIGRSRELVVGIHGMLCTRESWHDIAVGLCRDNAQAVVLAPDLNGFGVSTFASPKVAAEQASPLGLVRAVRQWLDLLGLTGLPTVLLGHSMGASALLAVTDHELGPLTYRVAVTPVFPFVDPAMRRQLTVSTWLLGALRFANPLRRWLARLTVRHGKGYRSYAPAAREALSTALQAIPAATFSRLLGGFRGVRPAQGDALDRCSLVVCDDDPVASADALQAALAELGFPQHKVHRLVRGGHLPYMEDREHPEWTGRNINEIVDIVSTLLLATREPTRPAPQPTAPTSPWSTPLRD